MTVVGILNEIGNFYFWRPDNKVFVQIVPVSDSFYYQGNFSTIVEGGLQCNVSLRDRNNNCIHDTFYVPIVVRLNIESGCDINLNFRFKYIFESSQSRGSYSVDIPGKDEPLPHCSNLSSGGSGGEGCFIRSLNW
jgi:hypothetical protein